MQTLKTSGIEIKWIAPQSVNAIIATLGRTEDICFSPNNRRLAIAAFIRNRIVVFDITIKTSAQGIQVELTGVMDLSSPALKSPHGMHFIDDETLIVANREGDVVIFKLPISESEALTREVLPVHTLIADGTSLVQSPGSVWVIGVEPNRNDVLICNNYINTVTRHVLDSRVGYIFKNNEVLLQKWIYIPDSLTISRDRQWLAVSSHETHSVMMYDYGKALNAQSDPDGILRGVEYPHGLRFSADGNYLFVADAGAPYLHVFARNEDSWQGVHHPAATFQIMTELEFECGRHNPQEGGPKGLDIDATMTVLAVTSECQPLTFFAVSTLIEQASTITPASSGEPSLKGSGHCDPVEDRSQWNRKALEISRELGNLMIIRTTEAETKAKLDVEMAVSTLINSKSWRITAPLRGLYSVMRSLKRQ